nr:porin [Thiomonas sp.]
MKKSLLALAVFGAFSGAVFAQSNVQLYGIIDMGVTHFTGIAPAGGGSGTVSSTGLSSGVGSSDRIGLKGTEDLGGGLKAFFTAETGFCGSGLNQDGTTIQTTPNQTFCTGGGFMQRQAFVGLAGGFGTLSLGRQYTPAFLSENAVDPFGSGLTGSDLDMGLVSHFPLLPVYALIRANQEAAYVTPDLSGFKGTVAYSFAPLAAGTVPTVSGAGSNVARSMAVNGQYANGPVMAGLTYTRLTNLYANPPLSAVNDGAFKMWQAYGSYDFGIAKLSGIYEKASADYSTGNSTYWMLGTTIPVGPGAILASYGQNKNDVTTATNPVPAGTAKEYAIGYTYSLSKRTDLYTSYAHISNGAGTALAVNSPSDSFKGVVGQGASGFALGIRHKF